MGDAAKNSTTATDIIKTEFNSITAENAMKPDALLNQTASQSSTDGMPVINTANLNSYLTYAKNNGLKVRGHVLVWHSQTPTWFFREGYKTDGAYVASTVMDARMESYIKQVLQYCQTNFPDVVYAWDVVNEATTNWGSNGIAQGGANGLRTESNDWYTVYGDHSYITKAFAYARQYAAAGVKLYYNDFNSWVKYITIVNLLADAKAAGNIDGIGLQSHLSIDSPTASQLETTIQYYINAGYKVSITEWDIGCGEDITDADREAQATLYGEVMDVLIANAASIENVTFWGLNDGSSWRDPQEPLLFDSSYQKKDSYYAVLNALTDN